MGKKNLQHIKDTIELLNINLTGKTILTEIGSGSFLYSGIIAALSGADKVILWTRDSNYGLAKNNIYEFKKLLIEYDISCEFIFRCNRRVYSDIQECDIICNLGFVRPIDDKFINNLNKGSVISYMAEAWEFRREDIHLELCQKRGIRVGAVWENHPDLRIFDKCGELASLMLKKASFHLNKQNVLIISGDHFGKTIKHHFEQISESQVVCLSPNEICSIQIEEYDLIFIADYISEKKIVGTDGLLKIPPNCNIKIVHLAGEVDISYAIKNQLDIFPKLNGYHHRMTYTLALVGDETVISLHAAGIKVGELLHNQIDDPLVQMLTK